MSKPLYVISCPYDTYSGYGARSRDYIKSVVDTGKYDVKLLAQRWGETAWRFCEHHPEWKWLYDLNIKDNKLDRKPDIWTQISIPNEFQPVGKYNIGVTAGIETTGCKPEWIQGLNKMDVNFVSSEHTKSVFQSLKFEQKDKNGVLQGIVQLEKPIEVLFEGANLDIYKPIPAKDVSLDLSDIKEEWCYLFVGHWMQGDFGHDRKNASKLVKAFFETFKNKKKRPALILKASKGMASYYSREQILKQIMEIRKTVASKNLPNVYLLNGEFSDEEMNELYNHPKVKAFVTFTKGEGFGRPLLEFSCVNKPIIASNWSGQVDFLNPKFTNLIGGQLEEVHKSSANNWIIKESKWFQIDSGEAGKALRNVFSGYKQALENAKRQGHYARTNFSYEKMVNKVDQLFSTYVPDMAVQTPLKLPKLQLPKLTKLE